MADTSQAPRTAEQDRLETLIKWVRANERTVSAVVIGIAIVAAGIWFFASAKARREAFAADELAQARMSADAGNLPLAASDLSRIVSSYGGTAAGQEAQLLLAEVRLRQGQPGLAATELQAFVDRAPDLIFRPQAYELLGVALEQTGQMAAAASAFEQGAQAASEASYGYMAASLLLNAARSFTAVGDTTGAVRALQRVVDEHDESAAASEARLRLAELGHYDR